MRPFAALAAGLVLLTGCAGQLADSTPRTTVPDIDTLSGTRVGLMAEQQLEALHPKMAPGSMTCPDLAFEVGKSVRCTQVADLSEGRRVRVLGTVTVTSVEDGGSLHVRLDDDVTEFGVTGSYLARALEARLTVHGRTGSAARCPYLAGVVGTTVRCVVTVASKRHPVEVAVTATDPETNSTSYRFDPRQLGKLLQRRLPFVATEPSAVVDLPRDHRAAA